MKERKQRENGYGKESKEGEKIKKRGQQSKEKKLKKR